MPLLKYKCHQCHQVFEELVFDAQAACACPHCGSEQTQRHYQGKCYFGKPGSGGGDCSGKSCSSCAGCSSQ